MFIDLPAETMLLTIELDHEAYFLVYVVDDIAAVRAFVRDVMRDTDEGVAKLTGCCYGCKAAHDKNATGIVVLAKTELGAGYVAHEMAHAAFRAIEKLGLQIDNREREGAGLNALASSVEERYCGIVEHLNAGFWHEAYRLGIAGDGGAAHRAETQAAVDALAGEGLADG